MKRRALTATSWGAADALSRQGLQFATVLVLARMLTPADFGVVAMLAIFVAVAGVLADGGFSAALIQRQDVNHTDESTVFWCNLGVGSLLAVTLAASGPLLAGFYGEPSLKFISPAMSLTVLAGAAGAVHFALLCKRLEFRLQTIAGLCGSLLSAAIAISMALLGFGVWALISQAVVSSVATTILLWWLHPWRPARVFSLASLRKLVGFGGYHLASTLMEAAYTRLYALLAGRFFGATPLGYYSNAENTRQLPASFVGNLVGRVALPMLASAQDDPELVRRSLQLSIRVIMSFYAPIMLAIVVLAEPLVHILYGPQWLPAVPLLRVLAIAGLLYPLHMMNLYALMARGHARQMFRLEVIKKALGVGLLLIGCRYGLEGLAWSQAFHSLLALGINAYYSGRWLGYGALAQLRDAAPPILAAAAAAGMLAPFLDAWNWAPLLELTILLIVGGAVYALLIVGFRTEAWTELKAILMQWRQGAD